MDGEDGSVWLFYAGEEVGDLSRGHWDTFVQWHQFKTDAKVRLDSECHETLYSLVLEIL